MKHVARKITEYTFPEEKKTCPFVSRPKRFAESAQHFDLSFLKSLGRGCFFPAAAEQAEEEELSKDPP